MKADVQRVKRNADRWLAIGEDGHTSGNCEYWSNVKLICSNLLGIMTNKTEVYYTLCELGNIPTSSEEESADAVEARNVIVSHLADSTTYERWHAREETISSLRLAYTLALFADSLDEANGLVDDVKSNIGMGTVDAPFGWTRLEDMTDYDLEELYRVYYSDGPQTEIEAINRCVLREIGDYGDAPTREEMISWLRYISQFCLLHWTRD